MSNNVIPSLSLAIARLTKAGVDNFAIWVIESPLPGGYVHYDCVWPESLTKKWLAWQEMFSPQDPPHLPVVHKTGNSQETPIDYLGGEGGYGGQLMQQLGINLWQWLFDGSIRSSLAQSQGIALGKSQCLRVRLEIRDPALVSLPWEIMQPESGKPSISLDGQILFSRTTTSVDPLPTQLSQNSLNILLVLGEPTHQSPLKSKFSSYHSTLESTKLEESSSVLQLETEAQILTEVITNVPSEVSTGNVFSVPITIHTLIQPTAIQLTETLDEGTYNIFFYAGHGNPAPNGGLLSLSAQGMINGTELAQVLVRNQVTLALFNACWGAQPAKIGHETVERSSLAEVLIHHGVPAVLAMRDSIADQEALCFIKEFTKALTQRMSIDQAVRVARQQLLTVYRFNQPAWTLPILYMHPEFNGKLLEKPQQEITQLPVTQLGMNQDSFPVAYVRILTTEKQDTRIHGGLMRVGRHPENDLVIKEQWVSQRHAEIICREDSSGENYVYYLRDFSRFGTFIYDSNNWKKIHHQEIPLKSGVQLKFGSIQGQSLEFVVEYSEDGEQGIGGTG